MRKRKRPGRSLKRRKGETLAKGEERVGGGIRGPGANRAVYSDVLDHTPSRPSAPIYFSSRSREISLSKARTLLAELRECTGIDSSGSIVIRDPTDKDDLVEEETGRTSETVFFRRIQPA